MRKTKAGFTITSLLVGMAVGSVVLLAILGIFGNIYRSRATTQKLSLLLVTSENLLNELTQEIHWSKNASIYENRLVLDQNESQIEFRLDGGQLMKNGEVLTPDDLIVTSFEITDRSSAGHLPLLQIKLTLEHKDAGPKAIREVETTISLRKTDIVSIE